MTKPVFDAAIPVLRIYDAALARGFYEGFLGFAWDWEHRFAPDLPLFAQVSRGGLRLYLSEHHGDGTPGTKVVLRMQGGLAALQAELLAKAHRHARPALAEQPWGMRDMPVADPFGNTLVFSEPVEGT